jgi:hypothetical protein
VYHSKKSSPLPFLLLFHEGEFAWCQAARVQSVAERKQAAEERTKMLYAFVEWEKAQVRPLALSLCALNHSAAALAARRSPKNSQHRLQVLTIPPQQKLPIHLLLALVVVATHLAFARRAAPRRSLKPGTMPVCLTVSALT